MSLLSGIRFVPKEKRPGIGGEDRDEDRTRDEKREKKRKHEKKHEKKHKSSRDHKRHHDKQYDSDSSSVDMEEIAKEEEERELREKRVRTDQHPTAGQHRSTQSQHDPAADRERGNRQEVDTSAKKIDPNHFRSLIDSLKKPVSAPLTESEPFWGDRPKQAFSLSVNSSSESEDERFDHHPAAVQLSITNAAPVNAFSGGTTNQSAAAMMRERLKNSKLNLSKTAAASTGRTENDFGSNIEVDRNVFALKNRYNNGAAADATGAAKGGAVPSKKQQSKHSRPDIDVALDINTLKSREKAGGEDIDDVFRDNVLRMGERYQGTELGGRGAFGNGDKAGMDEEGEIDMRMFQRKETSQAEALQREANKVMKAQQQLRRAVESCGRCTESARFAKQTVISTGENAYLRIKLDPDALVEGHLEIVPISHVSSMLQCDEETQKEIERFQSCLRRMYETQGKGVLFLETAVHFHSRPHAHIDVIPIERGMEAEANMFFKEAFFSCDEEWAQHRKIIELSSAKPLKRAVPSHFQYLAAEWGDPSTTSSTTKSSGGSTMAPYGGIVHPVESEGSIDTNFCLDVVAGLLELEPLRMRRRAGGKKGGHHDSTALGASAAKAVSAFKAVWSTFDWTQYM